MSGSHWYSKKWKAWSIHEIERTKKRASTVLYEIKNCLNNYSFMIKAWINDIVKKGDSQIEYDHLNIIHRIENYNQWKIQWFIEANFHKIVDLFICIVVVITTNYAADGNEPKMDLLIVATTKKNFNHTRTVEVHWSNNCFNLVENDFKYFYLTELRWR